MVRWRGTHLGRVEKVHTRGVETVSRELVLSVTTKDCILQTFRCGGKGGQNVNKRDTGVRWVHPPSGATGQSCDERSQLQNKRLAWRRMCETKEFRAWTRKIVAGDDLLVVEVERELWPDRMKTEVLVNGKWVEQ
jgi:hypothetical protein